MKTLTRQFTLGCTTLVQTVFVSGVVLKEKALQFAKSLHSNDFNNSDAWLDGLKSMYNVTFGEVSEEEKSYTPEMTSSWKEKHLPTSLSTYDLKGIFTADQFNIFYQALSSKSLHLKTNDVREGNSVRYV